MSQDGPGNGDHSAPVPSAPTEAMPEGFLAEGQVLGDRYQIHSQLGITGVDRPGIQLGNLTGPLGSLIKGHPA